MIPKRVFRWRGGFALALLQIILTTIVWVSDSQAQRTKLPEWFDFTTRLSSPAAPNETRVLRRGAVLYPLVRGSRALHQPMVLCEDLTLHFDEKGQSQLVRVQGFCVGLGQPAASPPEAFDWEITAGMAPTVAAARACQDARKQKAGERGFGAWQGRLAWSVPCQGSFSECYEKFAILAEDRYRRPLRMLIDDRTCDVRDLMKKLKRVGYSLDCYHH